MDHSQSLGLPVYAPPGTAPHGRERCAVPAVSTLGKSRGVSQETQQIFRGVGFWSWIVRLPVYSFVTLTEFLNFLKLNLTSIAYILCHECYSFTDHFKHLLYTKAHIKVLSTHK